MENGFRRAGVFRRAVRIANDTVCELRVEQRPDKTSLGGCTKDSQLNKKAGADWPRPSLGMGKVYFFILRRTAPARPTRPVPNSTRELGSGTGLAGGVLGTGPAA